MNKELIGQVSGLIVILSAIPYTVRAWRRETTPVVTTWVLWSFIGLALLVTYKSSGAEASVWPAVFGFINPIIITFVAIRRSNKWQQLTRWDIVCAVGCFLSLALWLFVRKDKELAKYALYVAIAADLCAAMPTFKFVYRHPADDRPGAWLLFGFGYGLAMFAVAEHTLANYILPAYMFLAILIIAYPLVVFRLKRQIPIREWI